MRTLLALSMMLLAVSTALAQTAEPSLGDRLGSWPAFILVFIVAVALYMFRRRRNAAYDPAAPTGTRLDSEH